MLCFPTQIKVGTLCVKDHQVLWLEHRLGLMEILKKIYFCLNKIEEKIKNIYLFKKKNKNLRPFNFANLGLSRN